MSESPSQAPWKNPIFCALDVPHLERAKDLAHAVAPHVGGFKLGLEFFCAVGRQGVEEIAAIGLPLFLDLKFHDIPNTVAAALKAVLPLKPAILNVHAAGGPAMMAAAAEAINTAPGKKPMLVAVTVLTSLNEADLPALGYPAHRSPRDLATLFGGEALKAGLDGVVCSAHEIAEFRGNYGDDIFLVVPGIRPAGAPAADQKRTMGPAEAMALGADVLVIGRPITEAQDPAGAAAALASDLRPAAAAG